MAKGAVEASGAAAEALKDMVGGSAGEASNAPVEIEHEHGQTEGKVAAGWSG